MTKQDGNNIYFGGGFSPKNTIGKHRAYPQERIIEFLNVDAKNNVQIDEFCSRYSFFPKNIFTDGLLKSFRREQNKLKNIASKLLANVILNEKELNEINANLGRIKTRVSYFSQDDFAKINAALGSKATKEDGELRYLTLIKVHKGPLVSLWEDLMNHFIKKQDILGCANCGKFILRESHDIRFCGDRCKNVYSKRKAYSINKIKKTSLRSA